MVLNENFWIKKWSSLYSISACNIFSRIQIFNLIIQNTLCPNFSCLHGTICKLMLLCTNICDDKIIGTCWKWRNVVKILTESCLLGCRNLKQKRTTIKQRTKNFYVELDLNIELYLYVQYDLTKHTLKIQNKVQFIS